MINPIELLTIIHREKSLGIIQPFFYLRNPKCNASHPWNLTILLQFEESWGNSRRNIWQPNPEQDWQSAPLQLVDMNDGIGNLRVNALMPLIKAPHPRLKAERKEDYEWAEVAWPFDLGCLRFYLPTWAFE